MRRRIFALFLSLVMALSLLPVSAAAATTADDMVQISKKQYALAPGVTEYELITNDRALENQQVGHIMEIKPDSSAELRVGYNDYNISAIASGSNWAMVKPTEQAQKAETVAGVDVVGVVNGDFFNMANGCPSGYTVMQGTVIRDVNSASFWIDSAGNAHVAANRAEVNAVCAAENVTVQEAVGGGAILLKDGQKTSSGGSYGDIANPRTVAGIKADGTVVIYMVNGRQAPYSVGMVYGELADIMLSLGCVDAINLDGGGSSVFATQREGEANDNGAAGLTVRCRPSDGYERSVSTSLMVISTAASDGVFDHASITPTQEVYTPGSTVQFTAAYIDKSGKTATTGIPTDLSWAVVSGGGTITADGKYTAADESTEGTVVVALKSGDASVGTATIELRWPDKLDFTNSSVSLDFGETSDLTFHPTYQGREVNYKDGDFAWSLSPTYYKFSPVVDPKSNNSKADFSMAITPDTLGKDTVVVEYYAWGSSLTYTSTYKVTELKQNTTSDGEVTITATVEYVSSGGGIGEKKPANLVAQYEDGIGKLAGNLFIADEDNSLRGTIGVALASNASVKSSVDVVVGMEPYVLMDFEDKTVGGNTISGEEYWKCHVGSSAGAGKNSYLTADEVKTSRLWIRDTTGRGVVFPTGYNTVVSAEEDSNVRFGKYAFRLGYNFSDTDKSSVASADFGFSGDVYVNTVQPTKIGMWINVPSDLANDDSILKAVMKGGAVESNENTSYMTLHDDGTMTYTDGKQLTGTASYVQYYSYDTDGNVTGSQLKDWAGKGWQWVEADISAYQMPIDVCRGYTVRVTSPQNYTKGAGYIYIDNLQFIYGTNTNDINNPTISSVTELVTGATLAAGAETELGKSTVSFEAVYHDNAQTDKYASGVDVSGVRVAIDGKDYTASATVTAGNLILPAVTLKNGAHTVTITVKDLYGNITTESYPVTINDDAGENALVTVEPQSGSPELGKTYALRVVNKSATPINSADVSIKLPAAYLDSAQVSAGEGYAVSKTVEKNSQLVDLHITKTEEEVTRGSELAVLSLQIPTDAASGDVLRYSVPSGAYEEAGGTATFSLAESTLALTAAYTVAAGQSVEGYPTALKVLGKDNAPVAGVTVYSDSTVLGTTDANGEVSYQFETAGRQTVYALDSEGGRSWNAAVVVCKWTDNAVNDGAPFGIQSVAAADASTHATITWLSSIGKSEAQGYIRYATSEAALASAANTPAKSELITFTISTDAMRLHTAQLAGLTADTTYYYQVGDGTKWSKTLSLTTAPADEKAATSFAVLGDIQTSDTSNLVAALKKIAEKDYDFAIQTGDAIDDVTSFNNWRALFTVLNAETLKMPMIHTLGNHEYYGDAGGAVSGSIFALPESAQASYYSVEYGSVYVGVINHGSDLAQALTEMKSDAAASDCEWKVLVLHEPIYGTTDDMDATARRQITDAVEAAGIEFVFSGDDHSYARTYPMKGGVKLAADSIEGAVYYISGDLSSKTNAFTKHEHFAEAFPHSEYTGCYLSVEATSAAFTVKAYDYNGNLLDTYSRSRTACQQGNHSFNENDSRYDLTKNELNCALCGAAVSAAASGYTGVLTTTTGGKVMLSAGVLQKDTWFALGEDICHAGANGLLHETVTTDTATCLANGRITAVCKTCGGEYKGDYTWAKGHTWDAEHVCTICNTPGVDIAEAALSVQQSRHTYTGSAITPEVLAIYQGRVLSASSSRYGTDAYISYQNNTAVGTGTVVFEGRGNFYGEASVTFTILPASVETITTTDIGMHSVTLSWTAAKGAQTYIVEQQNGSSWVKVGETDKTSYTVDGLESDTGYAYRVSTAAVADGKTYNGLSYSGVLTVSTVGDPAEMSETFITAVSAVTNGKTYELQTIDGKRYLFLPASADLKTLTLSFTVSGSSDALTLGGSLDEAVLSSYTGTIDLKTLAAVDADGSYHLTATLGELRPMTIYVMKSANLSTMYLTSSDPVDEGRGYVEAVKGNATTAHMELIAANGTTIYDGELTQLKARGNSTFKYYPKKSYQIKLATSSDLLGTQETVKTWVLLAGYADATQMHDKLFKDMAAAIGMKYAASCDWVDLYYDGEYRGTYLLSEKNSIGATSVNITDMEDAYEALDPEYGKNVTSEKTTNAYGNDIYYAKELPTLTDTTGGYLLELVENEIDEANGFYTTKDAAFNVKSPEYSGEEAVKYISEFYQAFEDAVYATNSQGQYTGYNEKTEKYYYDYCDLDSLVKMYLLQQLSSNVDAFASSLYFYKDADSVDSKMYVGPIWDMELSCGTGWNEKIATNREFLNLRYLSEALWRIPSFQDAVETYFKTTFLSGAQSLVGRSGTIAGYEKTLADSAAMNYVLWPYVRLGSPSTEGHLWADGTTFSTVTDDLTEWIEGRLTAMRTLYIGSTGGSGGGGGGGGAAAPAVPDTVTRSDGSTVETETKKDGSTVTTITTANGSVGTVKTDANGKITDASAELSTKEVKEAQKTGESIKIPAEVSAKSEPVIDISVPKGSGKLTVEIPVTDVTSGTVAVIVHEDGTEEIVKTTMQTKNGIQIKVEGDVTVKLVDQSVTFDDTKGHWSLDEVNFVVARGLFNGVGGNKFGVSDKTTRGMVTTVLARLAGVNTEGGKNWYDIGTDWAKKNGVSDGTDPTGTLTREQLAAMLYRYIGSPAVSGTLNATDADQVSDWAKDAMLWATQNGIIGGMGDGRLAPSASAERAQVAAMFARFLKLIA